jgi:hypothetical protein
MTTFIRVLQDIDKEAALKRAIAGLAPEKCFLNNIDNFNRVPGAPYVYWLPTEVLEMFKNLPPLQSGDREARHGGATLDDFRFLRLWTEAKVEDLGSRWRPMLKGGAIPPFATSILVTVNWKDDGRELKAYVSAVRDANGWGPNWTAVLNGYEFYGREGITWSARPHRRGHFAHVPPNCIFSHTGMMLFVPREIHWALLALTNSRPFVFLLHSLMARGVGGGQTLKYESGYVGSVPIPELDQATRQRLEALAIRGWKFSQAEQASDETSRFFLHPSAHVGSEEISSILGEIDDVCFAAYGFSDSARDLVERTFQEEHSQKVGPVDVDGAEADDEQASDQAPDASLRFASWSVGVAFGRFDWRLATGAQASPIESQPFDPLPAQSPGMLPAAVAPFHVHAGILVDDAGHPHDLVRLMEEVLTSSGVPVLHEMRTWLRRDFFPFHLQQYSKSRRRAPIYWPLSTGSGSYTLWIYYPSVDSQTLYVAVNDFVEPKIKQVGADLASMRSKGGSRSREEEKRFEVLQGFELELTELRDTLLKLAPTYRPNQDDGVQICAAPLWPLFRHKPWQKLLIETWTKLESGDYDWAHLAMNYWPGRVRQKCMNDRSLAIAHALEHLYVDRGAAPKTTRRRKKSGGEE